MALSHIFGNYRIDRITEVVEEFLKCGDFREGGFDDKGNFVYFSISSTKHMTDLFRRKVIWYFEAIPGVLRNLYKFFSHKELA